MTDTLAPVKYTVLERSLIGNEIVEAGAVVEYDGLPAENLAPMCDVGRARYQEYLETNKARVAKMMADNADSGLGDPAAFAAAVAKAVAEANAEAAARQAEMLAALQANQTESISAAVAAAIAQVFPNGTSKKAVDPTPAPTAPTADPAPAEAPLA
jgi:hypothetical protein